MADALPARWREVLADPGPVTELADWLADGDRLVTWPGASCSARRRRPG